MVLYRNLFRSWPKKSDFDKEPVLDRIEVQLKKAIYQSISQKK